MEHEHFAIERRSRDEHHPFAVIQTNRHHTKYGDIICFCRTALEAVDVLVCERSEVLGCTSNCGLYLKGAA